MPQTRKVTAHMTAAPHAIAAQATLAEAQARMRELALPQLPVLDGGKPRGVLLERDLLIAKQLGADFQAVSVGALVPRDGFTAHGEEPLSTVVRAMASRAAACVAIVEGSAVQGVLTTNDALRALAELLEEEQASSTRAVSDVSALSPLGEGLMMDKLEETAERVLRGELPDEQARALLRTALEELHGAELAELQNDQRELSATSGDELPLHHKHLEQLCSERARNTQALRSLLTELDDRARPISAIASKVSAAVEGLRAYREREQDALRFVS